LVKTATEMTQKRQAMVEALECAQVHEGIWVSLRALDDVPRRGDKGVCGLRSEHDEKTQLGRYSLNTRIWKYMDVGGFPSALGHAQMAAAGRGKAEAPPCFSQPDLIIAATGQQHGHHRVARYHPLQQGPWFRIFNPWLDLTAASPT
jgi:hypothetical protein